MPITSNPMPDERVALYGRMAVAALDYRDGKITKDEKDAIVRAIYDELFPPERR